MPHTAPAFASVSFRPSTSGTNMVSPILLIAEREFRTYVATLSFWLSLALAPLAAGAAAVFSGGHPPPPHVSIESSDPYLTRSAVLALQEAGRLEGRSFVFEGGGSRLVMKQRSTRTLDLAFSDGFPLSSIGRAMVGHVIERDMARGSAPAPAFVVREVAADVSTAPDATRLSRLAAMMMLWLTLTGSLGMLLQAVVRERANRALESLLAAAQGWQIAAGKMLGVGAVSLLVLACWFGSAAIFSFFLPSGTGLVPALLAGFTQPLALIRIGAIYVCAFSFYGAATVALGATARDSASAQNVVRPMFVLLLAGFFVALSAGEGALPWLTYLPPFTPFLLLVNSPGTVSVWLQVLLLMNMLAASLAMLLLAGRLLTIAPSTDRIFFWMRNKPQPVV